MTDEVEKGEEEGEEKQRTLKLKTKKTRGQLHCCWELGKLITDHCLQEEISKVQLHRVPSILATLSVLASPYREQAHNNLIITSQAN